jgi:hypothetical protein
VRPDGPHLVVGVEGLGQVLQDQATDVAVVGPCWPEWISGPFDEEIPEGDRQVRPGRAPALQVGVEQGELGVFTGAIDQQDLHRRVIPDLLVHVPQAEVAADPEHGKAGLLGPSVHGPVSPADHPLGVPQDDQRFLAERFELLQYPGFDHGSVRRKVTGRIVLPWKMPRVG